MYDMGHLKAYIEPFIPYHKLTVKSWTLGVARRLAIVFILFMYICASRPSPEAAAQASRASRLPLS